MQVAFVHNPIGEYKARKNCKMDGQCSIREPSKYGEVSLTVNYSGR
jgi:hypothetical protein